MDERARPLLLALIGILVTAGGLVMLFESCRGDETARAREFQELVGGLGFGPDVDLSRCAFSFDPRLCPSCPRDLGPVPAGRCFCPHHALSILSYRALDPVADGR